MKKLFSITISAVLLTALAIIVFISCKKETREIAYNTNQNFEKTEAQQVYEQIMKFREAREAYHADAKADNGYVSPTEARSILDGAINYEFSDVKRLLEDTELDTLRYAAPVTNETGLIAVNDLIDIYDRLVSKMSNYPCSYNCFMIKYPLATSREDNLVEIVFTRGNTPPTPPTPPYPNYGLDYFDETDNWIWGGGNGKCIIGGDSDAAEQLENKCFAMFDPIITRNEPDTLNMNYRPYDVEYATKTYDSLQSCISGIDYWLFHAENVISNDVSTYCIPYNYLNLYLINLYSAVINSSGCYHYSPRLNSPVRVVVIDDHSVFSNNINDQEYYNISHSAVMTYYKLGNNR